MEDKKPNADECYCESCGNIIFKEAEICPKCGVRQSRFKRNTNSKSKVTAGLLGILLGGIGAHKFYLGQTGMGILYLLFVWTFIPAIIGLIEGIIYLTMSDEEFQAKYC
jgi:TM2 domain-containing membrane protein YozV